MVAEVPLRLAGQRREAGRHTGWRKRDPQHRAVRPSPVELSEHPAAPRAADATTRINTTPIKEDDRVRQIEAELRRSGRVEIPSGEIGEMVMVRLRDLDEVAYIRFASVYREFMDLQQVKREIEQVLSSRRS